MRRQCKIYQALAKLYPNNKQDQQMSRSKVGSKIVNGVDPTILRSKLMELQDQLDECKMFKDIKALETTIRTVMLLTNQDHISSDDLDATKKFLLKIQNQQCLPNIYFLLQVIDDERHQRCILRTEKRK